jgi:1-phosphofructokinase family hexose kinase
LKNEIVLCVSANPALDRQVRLPDLLLGEVNRATRALPLPGGKAAHVALSTRALGARSIWIGFLGGAIGKECAAELQKLGVETVAIQTKSSTRVNLEIIEDSGRITEILEQGVAPDAAEQSEMLRVFSEGLDSFWKGALVAISGSLPAGADPALYASLIEAAHRAGSKVLLDTSGEALRASLHARPDFVKPNIREAELLLGRKLTDARSVKQAADELLRLGAQSCAITLGAQGLLWASADGEPVWLAKPPHLKAISTVGSGDATLAGFACAILNGWHGEEALRFATACGAANCLAEFEGRISVSDVHALMSKIEIETL